MIRLTPPRLVTFAISLLLVALAVASLYTRLPVVGPTVVLHRTWFLVGGYAVLALGVLSRRL